MIREPQDSSSTGFDERSSGSAPTPSKSALLRIHSHETSTSPSTSALVARMLRLAWRHRLGCLNLVLQQVALLALSLSGLGLSGLAIDVIRHQVEPDGAPPAWPWGLSPDRTWPPLAIVLALGSTVLFLALCRAALSYRHAVASARLVQQQIVVELRAAIYEKLHELSIGFFRATSTTSIINRVAGDAQAVHNLSKAWSCKWAFLSCRSSSIWCTCCASTSGYRSSACRRCRCYG